MNQRSPKSDQWLGVFCIGLVLAILLSVAYRLKLAWTTDWPALVSAMTLADWLLSLALIVASRIPLLPGPQMIHWKSGPRTLVSIQS